MVKYIGFYNCESNNAEKRKIVLAATNKMTYIADVLKTVSGQISILSLSGSADTNDYPQKVIQSESGVDVHLLSCKGRKNRMSNWINNYSMKLRFFLYCCKHIQNGEIVIVYHFVRDYKLLLPLKRIKKLHLILELEEIYGDVSGNRKLSQAEIKFAKKADGYIFPTGLLNQKINHDNKPYVLIHGTYQVEPQRMSKGDYRKLHGWSNEKIHVVYAGTFDPRKAGAASAVAAAEYLPNNYHVHILGFGSEKQKSDMQDLIATISEKSKATISYDGLLSGEDFIQFIQSCDIGLSTQNPDADFNATSFPSKILTYMANGLRVVSVRITAIEQSDMSEYMYYYDNQTAEEIARAIINVDINDNYDGRRVIYDLDQRFRTEIAKLISRLSYDR